MGSQNSRFDFDISMKPLENFFFVFIVVKIGISSINANIHSVLKPRFYGVGLEYHIQPRLSGTKNAPQRHQKSRHLEQ